MKTHVDQLEVGDMIYVETHFGDLVLKEVKKLNKYHAYVGSSRFMRKSGVETHYKNTPLTRSEQPLRDLLHKGNGVLFTEEEYHKRKGKRDYLSQREELIYQITRVRPWRLRQLSDDTLHSIAQLLEMKETVQLCNKVIP